MISAYRLRRMIEEKYITQIKIYNNWRSGERRSKALTPRVN